MADYGVCRGGGRRLIFRSTDGGKKLERTLRVLRGHGHRSALGNQGAGGMCLHTIILDKSDSQPNLHCHPRPQVHFVTDDGRQDLESPSNKGLYSQYIPEPTAEVWSTAFITWRCNPLALPKVLFMQKHWDASCRSDDARRLLEGSQAVNLPTDFGFVIDVHAHEPENHLRCADQEATGEHFPPRRQAGASTAARVAGKRVGGAHGKVLPQNNCYVERVARRHGRRLAR